MQIRHFLLATLFLSCIHNAAQAGMPGALCDAVRESDYLVEVTVDTTAGSYSSAFAQKNWAPKPEELQKIAKTAKITVVHKGAKNVGDALNNEGLISSSWGQTGQFWTNFFSQKQITILTGPGLDGWIADGGDEGIAPEPLSYQKNYEALKKAALACLAPKN